MSPAPSTMGCTVTRPPRWFATAENERAAGRRPDGRAGSCPKGNPGGQVNHL